MHIPIVKIIQKQKVPIYYFLNKIKEYFSIPVPFPEILHNRPHSSATMTTNLSLIPSLISSLYPQLRRQMDGGFKFQSASFNFPFKLPVSFSKLSEFKSASYFLSSCSMLSNINKKVWKRKSWIIPRFVYISIRFSSANFSSF